MNKVTKSFPGPCGHSENKTLEAENDAGIEELFDREAPKEFYQHSLAKLFWCYLYSHNARRIKAGNC
jgi:hypothetical protein